MIKVIKKLDKKIKLVNILENKEVKSSDKEIETSNQINNNKVFFFIFRYLV